MTKTDSTNISASTSNGVTFNEEERSAGSLYSETSKFAQWVIEHSGGLIKNEKQANYVLIGFIALAIIISLFLILSSGTDIQEKNIFNPETAAPDVDDLRGR